MNKYLTGNRLKKSFNQQALANTAAGNFVFEVIGIKGVKTTFFVLSLWIHHEGNVTFLT